MEADEIRAEQIRDARREVVRVLNLVYPDCPMSFKTLLLGLSELELESEELVHRDIAYLLEEGYIRWTNERKFQPWMKRRYELTAKGNAFAERLLLDPVLDP